MRSRGSTTTTSCGNSEPSRGRGVILRMLIPGKEPLLQVPSSSEVGIVHLVNVRLRRCDCRGFKHRSRCAHLRQAMAKPKRYVPAGQSVGGLWQAGVGSFKDLDSLEAKLDELRVAVLVDARTASGGPDLAGESYQFHGWLRGLGVAYQWALSGAWGSDDVAHAARLAAVRRMAYHQRTVMLTDGRRKLREIKL